MGCRPEVEEVVPSPEGPTRAGGAVGTGGGNLRDPELEDMTEDETEVGEAGDRERCGLVPSVEEPLDEEELEDEEEED